MGRKETKTDSDTIADYLRSQIARQARITAYVLFFVACVVFIASIKFATDRYARGICHDLSESSRILVETSQLESFHSYFDDIQIKLKDQLRVRNIEVLDNTPQLSWNHYSLDRCSLLWHSALEATIFSPTSWAGQAKYVTATINPRLLRTDLLTLILAICGVLFASYYMGTRTILRNINRKISEPVHQIWDGLRTGTTPTNLEIKEIKDLWQSLLEYRELLTIRTRMMITKAYHHELKSPAFYLFNQIKRIAGLKSLQEKNWLIAETLKEGEQSLDQLHKAMKKIATDDFARHPKTIDLGELIRQRDGRFKPSCTYSILGDKTLIKTLLSNLYDNAIAACENPRLVSSEVRYDFNDIVLTVTNPVNHSDPIDTDRIFASGFTREKANGTGVGLSLCQYIVELHHGKINASYSESSKIFKIELRFPSIENVKLNETWNP